MLYSDVLIIGGGIYGLYSAMVLGKRGRTVTVLEMDSEPLLRATYVNQARVHMGYHYPRSLYTATKSAGYFERFFKDYSFCIHKDFEKIYGISSQFSMTNSQQFASFCEAAGIPYEEVNPGKYFQNHMCEGAFRTREYTYDAGKLRGFFLEELSKLSNVTVHYNARVTEIGHSGKTYVVGAVHKKDGKREYETPFVLNTTYASVNQILKLVEKPPVKIKYELCEIIICRAEGKLKDCGITVMDGPFFSVMPFGQTGFHSLTSVTFTPHATCHEDYPQFDCMKKEGSNCSPECLNNCNLCPNRPKSSFDYMSQLARKYLREEYGFTYEKSLFSMKPILRAAEVDDSRPTLISQVSDEPRFVSVLSGKINTIYDLDEILAW